MQLLCAAFISCQEEDINLQKTNAIIDGAPDYVTQEQVLALLKDIQVKQSVQDNSRRYLLQKSDGGTTAKYFEKIDLVDYDNYSMLVSDYSAESPNYLFFIITIDKNAIEKSFYVKFTPSEIPKEAFNIKRFKGRMELTDPNGEYRGPATLNAGMSMEIVVTEVCETNTIISEITCSNGGNHGIGDVCDVGINDAHLQITTTTICHNEYSYTFVAGGGAAMAAAAAVLRLRERFLKVRLQLHR